MHVTITTPDNTPVTLEARDFDPFWGSPDYSDIIAPAYLKVLTNGAPYVDVTYASATFDTFTERHTPAGWRDGRCVGTWVAFEGGC